MMETLELQLETELKKLCENIQKIQWEDPWQYGSWLYQTYYFVCHSTRLLALAASRFSVAESTLHSRFIAHASEEKGHEFLALKDYQQLKIVHPDLPEKIDEFTATQLFYQSQYYWIEHRDPVSFFGYILVLESMASMFGKSVYEAVTQHYGEKPAKFLKVHSDDDPDHIKKAMDSVARLPQQSIIQIVQNMKISADAYIGICQSVAALERPRLKSVA